MPHKCLNILILLESCSAAQYHSAFTATSVLVLSPWQSGCFLLSSPPAELFGSPKSFICESLKHLLILKKITKNSDGANICKGCVGVLSDAYIYRDHPCMSTFYIADKLDKLTV